MFFKADALSACYHERNTMLCPDTLLKDADDAQWLGLPWTIGTKIQFERTHVPVSCDLLQPIYHLGGRYYLATKTYTLQLKSHVLKTTPLSIYHIPCDEANDLLKTGFGVCPKTLSMSIPLFKPDVLQYLPYNPSKNDTLFQLHYQSINIGPNLKFNKTVIQALDKTFERLDGELYLKLQKIQKDIDSITATYASSDALIIGSTALVLSFCNSIVLAVFFYVHTQKLKQFQNQMKSPSVHYETKSSTLHIVSCCQECQEPLNPNQDNQDNTDNDNQDDR